MTWPLHMVSRIPHAMITYVDGERIRTEINSPSYRFFGVDSTGKGVYRRYNDARSNCRNGVYVSFTYAQLGRFEVMNNE